MKAICGTVIFLVLEILACGKSSFPVMVYAAELPTEYEMTDSQSYRGDITYEGEIDTYTGLPEGEADEATADNKNQVKISDKVYYDGETGYFIYKSSQVGDIYTNIVPDMVTTEPVFFDAERQTDYFLYQDGVQYSLSSLGTLAQAGQYVLWIGSPDSLSSEKFAFTIASPVTNQFTGYRIPTGFSIETASRNDMDIISTRDYVQMQEEGDYQIIYRCIKTGLPYQLAVSVDRTPPTATLSGVKDGVATGPVEILNLEEGATVSVSRGGRNLGNKRKLTERGNYQVVVADAAGNATTYVFTIRLYFNGNGILALVLTLLSVVALFLYLQYEKKHLKIR